MRRSEIRWAAGLAAGVGLCAASGAAAAKVTEAIVKMMVAAPGGKVANAAKSQ